MTSLHTKKTFWDKIHIDLPLFLASHLENNDYEDVIGLWAGLR